MSDLLAISIGPVQEFIAAARRTADLQAGSELLVEIARHVAQALDMNEAKLIFPADTTSDGPNKILAEIASGRGPELAALAEDVARKWLRTAWDQAMRDLRPEAQKEIDHRLAQCQIDRFLEFYAAWVTLDGSYKDARYAVDRLLAGRKALRDFAPYPDAAGHPRSALDVAQAGVVRTSHSFRVNEAVQKGPLWLRDRETLDAVSVLKRIRGVKKRTDTVEGGGKVSKTPSTSFMAMSAILPDAEKRAPTVLAELKALADRAGSGADLGDLLLAGRAEALRKEIGGEQPGKAQLTDADFLRVETLRKDLLRLLERGEFPVYYAILQADGDHIGRILSHKESVSAHQEFSRRLADFAAEAKQIVGAHDGHAVYTGGDDVLALLPAPTAIACAGKLAETFRTRLAGSPDTGGTLSVGIAIVHFQEPLQTALEWAREAEREAKKTRNALAVAQHTRGGEPLTVSTAWGDERAKAWQPLVAAFRSGLTGGFPYELRSLAREFRGLELPADRLVEEARRILKRKTEGTEEEWKSVEDLLEHCKSADALEELAKQMVIARFLAAFPAPKEAAS